MKQPSIQTGPNLPKRRLRCSQVGGGQQANLCQYEKQKKVLASSGYPALHTEFGLSKNFVFDQINI